MTNKEAKEKLYMEWQRFLENNIDYAGISEAYKMAFKALEQITKITDIVDGTIDHFEYDDAMDMLYEIKGVVK
jgi:lipopolysaccharide biosynthesis regulator YciM